ncbi:lysylphosphatidylglycerol synthetase family protein [Paramagnetospirillum kuznetsovii]|uniref:Lysylphosphatidylglycerol synthetase family protein n=1 Tax=Paramagnetospirillum kuznetsovii TaxID=2053833 RepID=A0A364P0C0_9PROT|nr:lysylphosphatidylglycerol synthase transmembrane domain-containing protein [Paramagnetospirillum kuznetsovii]RAU22782.1 lysylphosphatidylglycerol synthetase family protein [Paramagnetospirillum kuznetsovii]
MVKRWLPWVLKGLLSVGLIWFVFNKVDLASAWSQAKTLDPVMLAIAFGLGVLQVLLGAGRWWLVLRALKAAFTPMQALMVYYIGVCFSIIIPVAGDAVRMWKARRSGLSLATSINSVMLERVITILGLILLVAATQPLLLARAPNIPGSWVFPLLSVVGIAGIVFLSQLDRLPASLHHMRLVRGLAHLAGDTRRLFRQPKWAGGTLIVAIIGHANLSLEAYALAVGLGLNIDLIDCLVLVPPVILIMTLPVTIAGFGLRETVMVTAFGYVGVESHSALVLSLLFAFTNIASALPGGLFWLVASEHPGRDEIEEIEHAAEDGVDEDDGNPRQAPEKV